MAVSKTPATPLQLDIAQVDTATMLIPIVGISPLIQHNWSAKAKRKMLEAQQGIKVMKEHRDPQAEYESSFYRTKDGYGIPSLAFKSATVEAARFYDKSVTKVGLMQFLFFPGIYNSNDAQPLFPLVGEPRMREDCVTVGISGTDLRFRAEFPEWSTTIEVTYVKSLLTRNSVLALINAGGWGVGVQEWRPEKHGENGRYRIDPTRNIEELSV